jgi:hypothetical protein
VTPFHRNLLDFLLRRFLIPLHCAFSRNARVNPLFHYSRKISLDTAMSIISPEPDRNFSHIMTVCGGLFREGMMLAANAISLELIVQAEDHRLNGTLHCSSQYRQPLKQAMKDMIASSLGRIRHGETNVKGPMFLSMILAQAEAIEADTLCELRIAQSAKDVLDVCHDILQTRIENLPTPYANDIRLTSTSLGNAQDDYGFDMDMNLDLDMGFFFSSTGFA